MEHLCEKLAEVKMDTPAIPLSEDTVVDVLAQCEQKLKMLIKGGSAIRDLMGGSGGMAEGERPGSAVREHTVRVKIEDNELNDDLPLEGDDDGVDDEVRSLANGVAALKTSCLTFWCVGNRSWTGTMSSAIRP